MSKYRIYLIFGASGSGKGTQGRTLGTLPCFFHCACGDVFRSIDTRTSLGKAFHEYSSKGQLVPDEITVELWRVRIQDFVSSHQFKPDLDYLLLDGIPRSIRQAALMDPFIRCAEDLSPELSGSGQTRRTTEEAGDQGQSF
jgi:adenylate kinase